MVAAIGGLRSAVAAEKAMVRPPLTPAKQAVEDQNAARDAAAKQRHHDEAVAAQAARVWP